MLEAGVDTVFDINKYNPLKDLSRFQLFVLYFALIPVSALIAYVLDLGDTGTFMVFVPVSIFGYHIGQGHLVDTLIRLKRERKNLRDRK